MSNSNSIKHWFFLWFSDKVSYDYGKHDLWGVFVYHYVWISKYMRYDNALWKVTHCGKKFSKCVKFETNSTIKKLFQSALNWRTRHSTLGKEFKVLIKVHQYFLLSRPLTLWKKMYKSHFKKIILVYTSMMICKRQLKWSTVLGSPTLIFPPQTWF